MKITLLINLGMPLALVACLTPSKASRKGKPKPKKAVASIAAVQDSPPPAADSPAAQSPSTVETTDVKPQLVYRLSSLQKNPESVYFKPEFENTADQIYGTVRFERTFDYKHSVIFEPTFRTIRENPGKMDSVVIEQAFIDSAVIKNLYLTAGKKTEYDGSGFMVNPSDLLNEDKDLFDPLYQKEGKVFTRLRYAFENASIGVGFIPKRGHAAQEGRSWLTAAGTVKQADLRLQAMHHETDKSTLGVSISRHFGDRFEVHYDGRYQSRQRSVEEPGRRYLSFSSYKRDDSSGFHLIGSRLTLTGRRTIIVEAIQQQSGLLKDEFRAYYAELAAEKEDLNKFEAIPTQLQGRHYAFVSYQDDDTLKTLHLGVSYLTNLNDQSTFANANALYHLSPITSLEVSTLLFGGKDATEFGEMPFPRAISLSLRGKF